MSIPELQNMSFTDKQRQYLAFSHSYIKLNDVAPAHTDMQNYFQVTPPTVNQMIKMLEKKVLIRKTPRAARSIEIIMPIEMIPKLG